ncbi:metallophosphoesterase [Metabacillus herbersteinensis]|uniref:Phosphoesterase n=1 Tax=Metabacillus herbersteinensis TaxID=283816 RepID=A0ABV6G966_9BACI
MNVLIISDSHGLTEEILKIQARHADHIDAMIHCGDSELASDHESLSGFHTVRGNCDYDSKLPKEIITEVESVKFYITHGHLHNIKTTLMNVKYRALECNADIVCFGHSHIAGAEMIDNILFINPGSIRLPRMRKERTYAILSVENFVATLTFYEVDGTVVNDLSATFNFDR